SLVQRRLLLTTFGTWEAHVTTSYPFQLIDISVVIPAYNEAERIISYLRNITAYLGRRGVAYEILVVDDGSRDETAIVVEKFQTEVPTVRILQLDRKSTRLNS